MPAPSPITPGPINTKAPANPSDTPATPRRVIRSSEKTCASGSTNKGSAAIEIPAKADGTCVSPHDNKKNGSAVFKTPITTSQGQAAKGGIGRRIAAISTKSDTAPSTTRAVAKVNGP